MCYTYTPNRPSLFPYLSLSISHQILAQPHLLIYQKLLPPSVTTISYPYNTYSPPYLYPSYLSLCLYSHSLYISYLSVSSLSQSLFVYLFILEILVFCYLHLCFNMHLLCYDPPNPIRSALIHSAVLSLLLPTPILFLKPDLICLILFTCSNTICLL